MTNNQYICQPEAEDQNQETPPEDSSTESESHQGPESPPASPDPSADQQIKKARKIPGKRGYQYPAQFEEFWQAYPRSNGKRPAYLKWEKLVINKKTPPEEIQEAAANYRDLCQLEGRRQKFMLHPRTFLGPSDHWVDYLNCELEATGQLAALEAARKRNQASQARKQESQASNQPGQPVPAAAATTATQRAGPGQQLQPSACRQSEPCRQTWPGRSTRN